MADPPAGLYRIAIHDRMRHDQELPARRHRALLPHGLQSRHPAEARQAVSAELAIRLAAALGGSAESWLTMQLTYDLARSEKKRRPRIERISDGVQTA